MRHAVILAGGTGTRLWPMSRSARPKQLIPLIRGKSLLQLADERIRGLVPDQNRYVCGSAAHAGLIRGALDLRDRQFLGEPVGRDTLNAIGLTAAVIRKRDPEAVIAVFTADQVIEPVSEFQRIVEQGFRLVEQSPEILVTFGVAPTAAATAYGYLDLGAPIGESARVVERFKEKPDAQTAARYVAAGPGRYLWNSGMFVWRAATLLDCIRRHAPENFAGLVRIGDAWDTEDRDTVMSEVFPALRANSVDFAVMEPAASDPAVRVAALPMPLRWIDIGSWPMFAEACVKDEHGNALGAGRTLLLETTRTVVASSDPDHLIATLGCEDLIVIHTEDATLVCHRDKAEAVKELYRLVGERFGKELT